jgi:ribonuclease R
MGTKKHKKKKSAAFDKRSLANDVLGIFSNNPKKTLNNKEVSKLLFITKKPVRRLIAEVLNELTQRNDLEEVYPGKFKLRSKGGHFIGKLDIAAGGYGFVNSESVAEDIFISQKNLNHALNGDTVKVHLYAKRKGRNPEGEVIEIIERSRDTFVGIVEVSNNFAFFLTDSRQMPYDMFIPVNKLNGAGDGQKVIARITDWPRNAKNPLGEVVEVLGDPGDNETEMHAILSEYGLPYKFGKEVEAEAARIPDKIPKAEYEARRDFRDVPTFTIDPEDARDFDDALSLRKLPGGRWEAGIHIADVTYYVKPKTLLEQEAYERGTSVYLVDRVVPMLPEKLSNNVCSLRPNEEKLCFSAVFTLDDEANVLDEWYGRTVILSNRRFTYREAQKIIDTGDGDLRDEVLKLNDLAKKLRKRRFDNGAIDFERVEVRFDTDDMGHPLRILFTEHGGSNELIEEFMLLANKKVAELIGNVKDKKDKKTFVYRVHDRPDAGKLGKFSQFIRKFGYRINLSSYKTISDSMNKLMADVKGKKIQDMVETLAVRTMAKAEYSTTNIGHYGLAFKFYTHFTSPIRRYPDMMVHHMLGDYLEGKDSKNSKKYEKKCRHSSDMEQRAEEAERASIKYKQVEFMLDKIGSRYEGIISGVAEWGIYVEIVENLCEGLVPMRELLDDFYEYDEDNYCLTGRHTGKKYQLGDTVNVEILRANLPKRQLDLALVDE